MTLCANGITGFFRIATLSCANMLRAESTQDLIRKTKFGVDSYLRNRKLVAGTLLLLLCVLYLFPQWFGLSSRTNHSDPSYICLSDQLRQYSRQEAGFSAVVQHWPTKLDYEKAFLPFVGNGHVGLSWDGRKERVYIKQGKTLSLAIDLTPLVSLKAKGHSSDAIITEYTKATVTKLNCYQHEDECVTIGSSVYVHRKYSNLIVQKINVRNPLSTSLELDVERIANGWKEKSKKTITVSGAERLVDVLTTRITSNGQSVAVSALLPQVPQSLTVKPRSSQDFRFLSVVDFSEPTSDSYYENNKKMIEQRVVQAYTMIVKLDGRAVDREHEDVWTEIWKPTFEMSYSHAPGALNADLVNATRYVILANTPAPMHEYGMSEMDISKWKSAMLQNELCYNAHNTLMYPSQLWSTLDTITDVLAVAYKWVVTLEKKGCLHLVEAGADGVASATVLSMGGLKFTHHHLEFGVHPGDLHRDYGFRNLKFSNGSAEVDIFVEVGQDNKALLRASIRNLDEGVKIPSRQFFACDAGCLDPPVALKSETSVFPVKLTDPVTPILYITEDITHMEELKHTIHVKEVQIAPAHEHHVIALHKHGHRLGGLPTLFWVSLAFLIVTFHLFLFKLIFAEYCRDEKSIFTRGRYHV